MPHLIVTGIDNGDTNHVDRMLAGKGTNPNGIGIFRKKI